jgi:hypothetical protein
MGARVLAIAVFVAALFLAGGGTALAGRNWCATDPILVFADGTRVQWLTMFSADDVAGLTGPVTFSFTLPSNAGPVQILFPAGGAPERVVISYAGAAWDGRRGMPVQASVLVPATTTFRTATTLAGNVARSVTFGGVSNAEVRASTKTDVDRWQPLLGDPTVVASFTVTTDATVDAP